MERTSICAVRRFLFLLLLSCVAASVGAFSASTRRGASECSLYSRNFKKVSSNRVHMGGQIKMLSSNPVSCSPIFMQNSIYLAVNKFASGPKSVNPEDAVDIDPNTAGMSPDEIVNYMSNVGGGLCGYPEALKSAVGIGLNVNLLVFGVFCVSYALLSGLDFKYKKDVEDVMGMSTDNVKTAPSVVSGGREFKSGVYMPNSGDSVDDSGEDVTSLEGSGGRTNTGGKNALGNRAERRLRGRK